MLEAYRIRAYYAMDSLVGAYQVQLPEDEKNFAKKLLDLELATKEWLLEAGFKQNNAWVLGKENIKILLHGDECYWFDIDNEKPLTKGQVRLTCLALEVPCDT